MERITRHLRAMSAHAAWMRQYPSGIGGLDRKRNIGAELASLGPTPDPDVVDAIIGNTSWTAVPLCSECGAVVSVVVQVGELPDYESLTAYLCHACLSTAADLAKP